jgi:hypothetical protein
MYEISSARAGYFDSFGLESSSELASRQTCPVAVSTMYARPFLTCTS